MGGLFTGVVGGIAEGGVRYDGRVWVGEELS